MADRVRMHSRFAWCDHRGGRLHLWCGGTSGLFSTTQQLGGALSVALLGTVFFGYLGGGHSFQAAIVHTAPYAMGAFAPCAVLSLLLPRTAVPE